MWFDVSATLVSLQESELRPALSRMTENYAPQVAEVAEIAGQATQKAKPARRVRANGFDADDGAFLNYLHVHGPSSYGACATALGIGATRAWQSEAQLKAVGLVRLDGFGRAELTQPKLVSTPMQNQHFNPPVAPQIQVIPPNLARKDK